MSSGYLIIHPFGPSVYLQGHLFNFAAQFKTIGHLSTQLVRADRFDIGVAASTQATPAAAEHRLRAL